MTGNTVPVLSIFFMGISALIGFGLPIGLFIFWRKKYELNAFATFVGSVCFIVFAMIFEQILHSIVLTRGSDGTILLAEKPFLYVLYGTMAAGVFEETGRFVCFHLLKKIYKGYGTSLAYGIGHGGVEAIFVLGFSMLTNIIFSVQINAGNIAVLGDTQQIYDAVDALCTTASPIFLVGGIERIAAVTMQISLSVLVWFAVNKKGKVWLYPAAILLHALIDVPAALMQCGVFKSIVLVEVMIIIFTIALAYLAVYVTRRFNETLPAEK